MVRGLVGMIHLEPLPGDPRQRPGGDFPFVERRALADAEALATGGVDALLVENFGSQPFIKGGPGARTPPHAVALLGLVGRACRERFGLPVGVNCLRNDALAAIGIAAAAGLDFVRVNVHVGAYVTDQGLIEGEAAESLRYRRQIGAEAVAIWADVLVKHAEPLVPCDPSSAVRDTFERGLADAVVVSGSGTGAPVDLARLQVVRAAAGERPVILGSGVTPENARSLCALADAAIVGTWLKVDGHVLAPVDPARVRRMADLLKGCWRSG